MANIIKKISAFEALPANGLTPDTLFLTAKDNANYKVSFDSIFSAIDWYMANSDSLELIDYIKKNYVNKTDLDTLATKEEVDDIRKSMENIVTGDVLTELNDKIDLCATKEYVDTTFITEDDLMTIHDSFATKDNVYTKEETLTTDEIQTKLDEIVLSADNKFTEVNEATYELSKRVQTNELNIEKLQNKSDSLEGLIKTDGDGRFVLGNDGKYHNLTCLSMLAYGKSEITSDNLFIGEDKYGHVYEEDDFTYKITFDMPKIPYKHTIHAHVNLGVNPLFPENNARILKIEYDGEINDYTKRFISPLTSVNLIFENEVVQFEDEGGLKNYIKSSTYLNEDKVSDTVKLRGTQLDLLHDTYAVTIYIKLDKKLTEGVTHDFNWHVFGHGILEE
ncbi:MAG: hypothetical protein J6D03_03230 [Clostridia bacterium]|nr:hypothetical protein [Clostridia bacterium]